MKKKLNIAILTVLLMFQTVFSPISVFADGVGTGPETDPTNNSTLDNVQAISTTPPTAGVTTTPATAGVIITNFDDVNFDTVNQITLLVGKKDVINIPDYRPQTGETIELEFKLDIPGGHDFGAGSTITYPLSSFPSIFSNLTGSGEIGEVGTFGVQNGNVVLTFNENVRDDFDKGIVINNLTFGINVTYNVTGTDLEHDLDLKTSEKITLKFKPKGGKPISKSNGKPENDGKSSTFIDWTVDVNTELNELTNAMFSDTTKKDQDPASNGHTYKANSLVVKELIVAGDGKLIEGTTILDQENNIDTGVISVPSYAEGTTFSLNLPNGTKAYRISYKTVPEDTDKGSETYRNEASFSNNGEPTVKSGEKSATVTYGTPLEKKAITENKDNAEWEIKYNFNRKAILAANAVLTDDWTTKPVANLHTLDGDVVVYEEDGATVVPKSNYEVTNTPGVDPKGNAIVTGFKLKFTADVKKPYIIKYKTKKTDLIDKNGSISNTVTRSDRPLNPSSDEFQWSQSVLVKTNGGLKYQGKTIDWTILLNEDKYNMNGVVITDTFENQNLILQPKTFKITRENGQELKDGVEYTLIPGIEYKVGFKVVFNIPVTEILKIEYTTDYEIKTHGQNTEKFPNHASVNWKTDGRTYESEDRSTPDVNIQQNDNGYKSGVYNYETKRFEWTVGINYNFNTITTPIFEDTLTNDQEILLDDTFKVELLDLSSGGNGEPISTLKKDEDYTVNPSGGNKNKFTLTFSKPIDSAYRITYQSKDADGFVEVTGTENSNITVKNQATLKDGESAITPNGKWDDTVTVHHTDELLDKKGSQVGQTSKVDWSLELN